MIGVRRLAWRLWEPLSERAGRSYIAGPAPTDAIRLARGLAARGLGVTVGFWNAPGAALGDVEARWRETVELLDDELDLHVALKAPALGFDPARIEPLAAAAAAAGATVHLDAHWPEATDRTLALAARLRALAPVRVALPARWWRSVGDAAFAVEHGLEVRIVKGEWPQEDEPERDAREGFVDLAERLAGAPVRVGVATHDVPLADEALAALTGAGTPAELELLFGLPLRRHSLPARRHGVGVRVYVPFGTPFSPYTLSTVRTDRRAVWWIARDLTGIRPARWRLESEARRAYRRRGAGRAQGAAGADAYPRTR